MKVIVFGATGGIGSRVIEQGVEAGHEVTAVARRPSAITFQHERLTVLQGDVFQPATYEKAIADSDVVVSALGARDRKPTTVYSEGVANIMQAMQGTKNRRLFVISATGLEPGPLWQRIIAKPILWVVLKEMYTDLVRMENEVKASGLDWTIVRPPRLTDKPRTGEYQIAINRHLPRADVISRADVADYIIRHLKDTASYCGTVEIAY